MLGHLPLVRSSSFTVLPFVYTPNERFHVVSSVQFCIISLDFWGQGSVSLCELQACWDVGVVLQESPECSAWLRKHPNS